MTAARGGNGAGAGRAFWITLALLFTGTLALLLLAALRDVTVPGRAAAPAEPAEERDAGGPAPARQPEPTYTLPPGSLQRAAQAAARDAAQAVRARARAALAGVFAPVQAAIPAYADYHYSVLGEYAELARAALGGRLGPQLDARLGAGIEERLLGGLDGRLDAALAELDALYGAVFARSLRVRIAAAIPPPERQRPLAEASRLAIDDTLRRLQLSAPLAAAAAGGTGALALKQILASTAAAVAAKSAGKAAGKGALKLGGSVAGGAGSGAAAGAFLGPVGAAVGGIAGAAAAWISVDWLVIRADEYLHRDDFESRLRALLGQQEARLRARIDAALEARGTRLAGRSLRELHGAAAAPEPAAPSEQRRDQHDQGGDETDAPDQ